jgi:hypothetical protein
LRRDRRRRIAVQTDAADDNDDRRGDFGRVWVDVEESRRAPQTYAPNMTARPVTIHLTVRMRVLAECWLRLLTEHAKARRRRGSRRPASQLAQFDKRYGPDDVVWFADAQLGVLDALLRAPHAVYERRSVAVMSDDPRPTP